MKPHYYFIKDRNAYVAQIIQTVKYWKLVLKADSYSSLLVGFGILIITLPILDCVLYIRVMSASV